MKKILVFIIAIFSFLSFYNLSFSSCSYDWGDFNESLEWCFDNTKLVNSESDLSIKSKWFQEKILDWRNIIAFYAWLWAIFWLIYAWFTLAISTWDDEKIWKAKNIAKWSIFWLLVIIFASVFITLIVNIFYSI